MLEKTWTIEKKARRKYIDKDGAKLSSVTEILDALGWNKGALMGWANKVGRGGQTINQVRGPKADAGTLGHHLIECVLNGVKYEDTQEWHEALPEIQAHAKMALEAFCDWWRDKVDQGWRVIDCEIPLQSEARSFAGTADLMLADEFGEPFLADIKTGSPHAEAFIQLAGYSMLWSEMKGQRVDYRGLVIHVPVDGRAVTEHWANYLEMASAVELFNNLLTINEYKQAFTRIAKRMWDATPKLPEDEQAKGPF